MESQWRETALAPQILRCTALDGSNSFKVFLVEARRDFPAREISRILGHECGSCPHCFQRNEKIAKVANEIHLPQGTPRAPPKNAASIHAVEEGDEK